MASTKPNFSGKWKLVKSENFEEFLAANGVNWMIRKMASKASPSITIEHEGDNFYIKTVTPIKTQETRFTVGQPFTQEGMMDSAKLKVSPWWDGNILVSEGEPEEEGKGKPFIGKREIVNGQLVMTMKVGDVEMTRWFDKV